MFYKALMAGAVFAALPGTASSAPYIVTYERAGVEIDRFRIDTAAGRANVTPGYAFHDLQGSARGYDSMYLLLNANFPEFGIGHRSVNDDNVNTVFSDVAYGLYAGDGFNLNVSGPTSFTTLNNGRLVFRKAPTTNLKFTIAQDSQFVESFVLDPNAKKKHALDDYAFYDLVSSSKGANAVYFNAFARNDRSPLRTYFGIGAKIDGANFVHQYFEASAAAGLISKLGDTMNVVAGDSFDLGGGMTMTVSAAGAVPEPAAWGMMMFGFGSVGAVLRARRRTAVTYV